jgi:hypothetical protein
MADTMARVGIRQNALRHARVGAVRVLNAVLVIATLLAYVGGYVQEKRRLATTLNMPAAAARDRYERLQQQRERVLAVVTAVLVAGAVAAGIMRAVS